MRETLRREQLNRVLDLDMTLERLAGDETLLGAVTRVFMRTAPEMLGSIRAALSSNDLQRAFGQAHSLKGAVGAFEAPAVLNSVLNVERHAKNEDAAGAAAAFATAQPLVDRLLSELQTLVAQNTALDA